MTNDQIWHHLRTHLEHPEEFGDIIGNIVDEITGDWGQIHKSDVRRVITVALEVGIEHGRLADRL